MAMRGKAIVVLASLAVATVSVPASAGPVAGGPLPTVSPTPRDIQREGPDVPLGDRVRVVVSDDTDPDALDLLGNDAARARRPPGAPVRRRPG